MSEHLLAFFRSLFITALLTGLTSGIVLTFLHLTLTSPIILKAEQFEQAEADGAVQEWAPSDGWERAIFTAVSDLVLAVGCASLMIAAMTLLGRKWNWKYGATLGIVFFTALHFAPSFGLPPELPGTEAGPLFARQIWFLGTVIATLSGLGFVLLWRKSLGIIAGLALLAAPHLIGAPGLDHAPSTAPADLQSQFHLVSLLVNFVFWLVMGSTGAVFYNRYASREMAS